MPICPYCNEEVVYACDFTIGWQTGCTNEFCHNQLPLLKIFNQVQLVRKMMGIDTVA